jgi:eukaryotic-like serine/threonine-protein kinase
MSAHWPKLERIYNQALELDPADRSAFLSEACQGDRELRDKIESLLAHASAGGALLPTSAWSAPRSARVPLRGPFDAGTVLGNYRIVSRVGEAVTGIVYQAVDTRLRRNVALKIIRNELAADAEACQRFERAAREVASLTHANIAAIYGFEQHPGTCFLVLEFVPGETLADRLRRGPMPIRELLPVAKQVAEALEAAHEKGIVHGDLKPSKIKIAKDGQVKVLDFGLPIRTVGTPYMSPEQARGDPPDSRTDVWSFGCFLYEGLTGKKAFGASTIDETLARMADHEPDWQALPGKTPQAICLLVHRCLREDLQMRLREIRDARLQIEEVLSGRQQGTPRGGTSPWLGRYSSASIVGFLAIAAAITFTIVPFLRKDVSRPDPVTFTLSPPEGHSLLPAAVPSPDGRQVAFLARNGSGSSALWLRSVSSETTQRLSGTEGAYEPFWSPDSTSIAFFADGKLKRVPVSGGPAQNICNAVGGPGGTWNRSGDIVVALGDRTPLYRVPAAGGNPVPVTTLDAARHENSHRWPYFLRDGKQFLFTALSSGQENTAVYVGSFDSSAPKRLMTVQSNAMYTDPGYLLFGREGTLMAQRFNAQELELAGEPLPIGRVQQDIPSAKAMFSVSARAPVIAFYDATQSNAELHWYGRSGVAAKVLRPRQAFSNPRISPDGTQVAMVITDPVGGYRDIWTMHTLTGRMTRVTSDPANDWFPIWTRNGNQVLFASDRSGHSGIFRKQADGLGNDDLLLPSVANGVFPLDVSPDNRILIYHRLDATGRSDLWMYPLDGRISTRWSESESSDPDASFSSDSKHVAYSSDESGKFEVYVSPIDKAEKHRISTNGGRRAVWRGNDVFYIAPDDTLMSVAVTTARGLQVGTPTALFRVCTDSHAPAPGDSFFDATSDGRQFAVLCLEPDIKQRSITVMLNWRSGK